MVWKQPAELLSRLPNLRAVFSIGAGVDHLIAGPPACPTCRSSSVVADNLAQHMTEYVVWRVLDHHRQGLLYRSQQGRQVWHEAPQRVASDIAVGIMGFGQTGPRGGDPALSFKLRLPRQWLDAPRDRAMTDVAVVFMASAGLIPFSTPPTSWWCCCR